MLINSDGFMKLVNPPQVCLISAPEATGSSCRASSRKVAPTCPERSASSLTSYPSHNDRPATKHLGICRNRWPAAWSAHVAQTGVPTSSGSSQNMLKIPGREHRASTAQKPAAPSGLKKKQREENTFSARKGRGKVEGNRNERSCRVKGNTESLLSILLPSQNPSCFSH